MKIEIRNRIKETYEELDGKNIDSQPTISDEPIETISELVLALPTGIKTEQDLLNFCGNASRGIFNTLKQYYEV